MFEKLLCLHDHNDKVDQNNTGIVSLWQTNPHFYEGLNSEQINADY